MDELKKAKRVIRRNLVRLAEQITKQIAKPLNFESLSKLEAVVVDYKSLKVNFEQNIHQLLMAADDTDDNYTNFENLLMKEQVEVSDTLFTAEAKIRDFHKQILADERRQSLTAGASSLNQSVVGQQPAPFQVKLKDLNVPTFDGKILNFNSYRGLFENVVHNRDDLTNVQKLHFLKESLIGDAKLLVRDFKLDERSYPEAWAYVLSRFDNPRSVVRNLFCQLTNLEMIQKEADIRRLLDTVDVIVRGLTAAGERVDDTFSRYITYLVSTRLDKATAREWENSVTTIRTYPLYNEIQKFLQIRAFAIEDRETEDRSKPKGSSEKKTVDKKENKLEKSERKTFVTSTVRTPDCVICKEPHFLNNCSKFKNMKYEDRFETIKTNKLCIKCFSPFHIASDCTRPNCHTCSRKHHTMLHRKPNSTSSPTDPASASSVNTSDTQSPVSTTSTKTFAGMSSSEQQKVVLLSTAVVNVVVNQRSVPARLLLDGGSELTLVTNSFVKCNRISTRRNPNATVLYGITNGSQVLNETTDLILKSRFSNYQLAVTAEIVQKIPYSISKEVQRTINSLPKLNYAELELPYNTVDIILGAEFCEFVMEEQRYLVEGIAIRNSKFGHIISGSRKASFFANYEKYVGLTRLEIDDQLKRFWETEETMENDVEPRNNDHKLVEEMFESSYNIDENNQFVVDLLTKPGIEQLRGSYGKAIRSLLRHERHSTPATRKAYCDFMSEYEQLGHMKKLKAEEISHASSYYIPHHIVSKPTSSTTKHRVVFNASSPDLSGFSLNDFLHVGPVLQPELFDAVIRFRLYNVAFVADIEKMYRKFLVRSEQRRYQRILWRSNPNQPVEHYELQTVTYGTASAPYLATKCLQKIAETIDDDPETVTAISKHFYVDDLMTGHQTVEQAIRLQQKIHTTLNSHHLSLRKYQSNSSQFLESLDKCLIEETNSKLLGAESFVWVLGLVWHTNSDRFRISLSETAPVDAVTKRIILSEISKVFDVLGLLSPITIRGKMLMQDLWREQLKWDDVVNENLVMNFMNYREDLLKLRDYSVDRRYSCFNNVKTYQLIGFCDASPKAYCAAIYMRSIDYDDNVCVNLVCAKTRVAPLNVLTIPRLELKAAVLLAKLMSRASTTLNNIVDANNWFLFSDSNIVLCWLKMSPCKLKIFVANRVEKITKIVNIKSWYYVPSKLNPADLATRGLSADQFFKKNNVMWTFGPEELKNDFERFIRFSDLEVKDIPEIRSANVTCLTSVSEIDNSILEKYSSYNKLINVVAYIYRFFFISSKRSSAPSTKILNAAERKSAVDIIVQLSQRKFFRDEIERLVNKENCLKGPLKSLDPFLDQTHIIRVGGRLRNSTLAYDKKHPIILSAKCHFVLLLVRHIHEKNFHCSKDVIVSQLTSKHWIIGGYTNVIKRVLHECILCRKLRAVVGKQIMGQLPQARTSVSRPFTHVGIDFTGHFTIKCLNHRSTKYNKAYAAFFVCLATRLVHIEFVSDMTAENFIETLKRFTSRRGKPNNLYSDNGSNFEGAHNMLTRQREKLEQWASNEFITWKFNIPRTPHQGGLWEAAIKSGKSLLLKATKNYTLTLEQLITVLTRVECILNSRPICYRTRPDRSTEILTPGHFAIMDSFQNLAEDIDDLDLNLGKRLTQSREIVNQFWKEWSGAYLNQLQQRNKWREETSSLNVNDIVLIKDDNAKVLDWPMGRIIEILPDRFNKVRNYVIKTANNTVRRNITKLVKLVDTNLDL